MPPRWSPWLVGSVVRSQWTRSPLGDGPPNNRQSLSLGDGVSEAGRRRNASPGHGIDQGRLGDPVPQQFLGDDIHIHAQNSPELLAQASQPHQRIASRRVEIHDDVDVAIGGGVTAGDGSEEPRIAGSVAPQDLVQLLTARSDGFPGVGRGVGDGQAPQNRRENRRSP